MLAARLPLCAGIPGQLQATVWRAAQPGEDAGWHFPVC